MLGKKQGKHREFENLLMRESQDQDNNREQIYCITSMVLFLKLKMLSLYYGNTQGKLKLKRESRENTGNFAFGNEWEQ